MEIFLFSANCILPIVLVMALGYGLRHLNIVSESFVSQANTFCFQVTLPIQLFVNIYSQDLSNLSNGKLILFSVAAILVVVGLLCVIIPRMEPDRAKCGSMIQGIFRGNFLLFGLPLALNMFGKEGVASTALLLPVAIPLYNVLAVVVLTHYGRQESDNKTQMLGQMTKGIVTNPLIIASVLALVMTLVKIPLPAFVSKSLSDVGATATPMALMMLGAQFDFSKLKGSIKQALGCSLARLILIPAVVVTCAVLFGFRGPQLGAIFILFVLRQR